MEKGTQSGVGRAADKSGFDRAADKREDLGFLESQLDDPASLIVPLWRGQVFVPSGTSGGSAQALVLERRVAGSLVDECAELIWLGLLQGVSVFAIDVSPLAEPTRHAALSGSEPRELRTLLPVLDPTQLEVFMYARALLLWHDRHRFCSVCGQSSKPRKGGHLRVCSSQACRSEHFPRTDPCVLVLVTDGDRCLLGRSKGWPEGMYSALAGFVEPGESLEQAVAREVLEEVSVEVGAMRYTGSQPWPFPASLMVGFVAEARTREIQVDMHELEAARWVTRDELKAPAAHGFFVPPRFAIAGQLIAEFAAGTLVPPSATPA
ncbi:MAG: NAD(+) diphosphatase [Polyangiales bacterium]